MKSNSASLREIWFVYRPTPYFKSCHLKIMLFFDSEYLYFVRTTVAAFFEDWKHVKKLTELHLSHILSSGYKDRGLRKYCNNTLTLALKT